MLKVVKCNELFFCVIDGKFIGFSGDIVVIKCLFKNWWIF